MNCLILNGIELTEEETFDYYEEQELIRIGKIHRIIEAFFDKLKKIYLSRGNSKLETLVRKVKSIPETLNSSSNVEGACYLFEYLYEGHLTSRLLGFSDKNWFPINNYFVSIALNIKDASDELGDYWDEERCLEYIKEVIDSYDGIDITEYDYIRLMK